MSDASGAAGWIPNKPAETMSLTTVSNCGSAKPGWDTKAQEGSRMESMTQLMNVSSAAFAAREVPSLMYAPSRLTHDLIKSKSSVLKLLTWPWQRLCLWDDGRNRTCLVSFIRAEPAVLRLLWGGRGAGESHVSPMLLSCLAVREHFLPDTDPIWTIGARVAPKIQSHWQDWEWRTCIHRAEMTSLFFVLLTNK